MCADACACVSVCVVCEARSWLLDLCPPYVQRQGLSLDPELAYSASLATWLALRIFPSHSHLSLFLSLPLFLSLFFIRRHHLKHVSGSSGLTISLFLFLHCSLSLKCEGYVTDSLTGDSIHNQITSVFWPVVFLPSVCQVTQEAACFLWGLEQEMALQ